MSDANLGITSGDAVKAFAWMRQMVDDCESRSFKAEEIALGGLRPDQSVDEVLRAFGWQRAAVQFIAELTSLAVARYGYVNAPVWPELSSRLQGCIDRCAVAGDLIERARAIAFSKPSAATHDSLTR